MVQGKVVGRELDDDDVGHASGRARGACVVVVAVVAWRSIAVHCGGALRNQSMMGRLEAGGTEEFDSVDSSEPENQKDLDIIWVHSQAGLELRGA